MVFASLVSSMAGLKSVPNIGPKSRYDPKDGTPTGWQSITSDGDNNDYKILVSYRINKINIDNATSTNQP